jgi:putative addiction module component (TIGR02574 family)
MATNLSAQEIIVSALQLPDAARFEVMVALQESLIDNSIEHPPAVDDDATWGEEIARRIADIDSGRVKTIPSEVAEKMIRGDVKPRI